MSGLSKDQDSDIVGDAIQIEGPDGSRALVVTRSSDGKKALATDAVTNVEFNPEDTPGFPCFTKKLRVEFDGTDTVLTSTFQTIYSYSGSGKFIAFAVIFEGVGVTVKFSVDGDVIFEMLMADLHEVSGNKEFSVGNLFTDAGGKKLFFQPIAICFESEVKLEAKDSGGKKVFAVIAELTKET